MSGILYQPIGIIHTSFKEQSKTPIQGVFSPDSVGEVELYQQYSAGLKDISGFSYIILIYHFHLSQGYTLLKKPFLDNEEKGIFSIRHYDRPNPIGISVVRLNEVKENRLTISEVDIIDGTPLLDIKPYIPDFDIKDPEQNGWYADAPNLEDYLNRKGIQPQ
ncbi:MAG: tRNA (N6-threonylcarbamoyladenosine(37)-N6)-methyltransferase TrmO [Dehalococcoidales bacterium]|nr:tRNA (N6-threonylcarbamoyladenosine(37)-N6)-methyltransferase TrmO [Dehalococcoidales bacterium]